jgi:hypothetical protein
MDKITKAQAIESLLPTAKWTLLGDTELIWADAEQTQPTKSEIEAEVKKLQSEYDALAYARNRAAEYPSQGDQNDMMYKDTKNSTTTHADAVEAIKTKWPKDNSGPVE